MCFINHASLCERRTREKQSGDEMSILTVREEFRFFQAVRKLWKWRLVLFLLDGTRCDMRSEKNTEERDAHQMRLIIRKLVFQAFQPEMLLCQH